MPSTQPVVFGSVGLGGYARPICDMLVGENKSGAAAAPAVRYAAVAEPDHTTHAEIIAKLRGEGIKVFERVEDLLALPEVEAVWLPLPIDLHRPFTEKALAAGKAVMCEKPAAGSIDDVDAMIAARDRAKLPVAIGYQDVYDATTAPTKRRLLAGEIGRIKHATVHACWPRTDLYFTRADWAGRFKRNGTWVMDSPANNALAHYVNIPLFLMGPTAETSAQPVAVEAELYRANPIENYDTISMKITLDTGATLLVLFTHACEQTLHPEIVLTGEKGKFTRTMERVTFETAKGPEVIERKGDARLAALYRFAKAVRGQDDPATLLATLEVARAPLAAVNGASEASAIYDIPAASRRVIDAFGGKLTTVPGIEPAFVACAAENQMLHESGRVSWSHPAGEKDLRNYKHFAGPREKP
jgi:predicted dehydrogenase